MEIVLSVKGMKCSGCENRIKNVVGELEGVENVDANHEDGLVSITCNDRFNINEAIDAIEDLDFEVLKPE